MSEQPNNPMLTVYVDKEGKHYLSPKDAETAINAAFRLLGTKDGELADLRRQLGEAQAEANRLKDSLHRDRSEPATALLEVIKAAKSRLWLVDGRGSYSWDDDGYRREAGAALHEVIDIAEKALKAADEAAHVAVMHGGKGKEGEHA